MADLAKYIVALEAETAKYQRELNRANRQLARFGNDQKKTLKKIDGGFVALTRTVRQFQTVLFAVAGGAGLGSLIGSFSRASDEVALFDARLKSALGGGIDLQLREELVGIATETGQAIKQVVDLFQQTSRLRDVLQATNDDFVQFSENVFRLAIIGGSSTEEAANGLRQLRQALASTRVQAEEINSIIEQTPEIAAAIEDSLGLMPGTLKQAVKEGRVLNDQVFQGILDKTEEIDEKFKEFPRTFAQFRSAIGTEFGLLLAATGELAGITPGSKEALGFVERLVKGARLITESFLQAQRQIENVITIDAGNRETFVALPSDEAIQEVEAMFAAIQQLRTEDMARRLEMERALMDQIAAEEVEALRAINEEREQFSQTFADNMIQAADSGFDAVLKSWVRTLQQMLARAAATKIFEALFPKGIFTSGGALAGLGQALGFRADGGGVMAGAPYVVGERGPELFVPSTSGSIVPNNRMGGLTVNVAVDSRADAAYVRSQVRAGVADAVAISRTDRVESRRRSRP